MLFQLDLAGGEPDGIFGEFWASREADPDSRAFAERLVRGVHARTAELDAVIAGAAEHWRVDRMAVVDRNVLRVAVYEMVLDPETPPLVIIDEAIEVGKRFGSEKSGAFINGILDGVRRKLENGELRGIA
jgi:N utilization substance protein B